ncbi:hypothetical protein Tco_0701263, partial [Tanacetum coccineum]
MGICVEEIWITNPCLNQGCFLQFYKRKFQAQIHRLCSLTFSFFIPLIAWIEKLLKDRVTLEEIKVSFEDCGSSVVPFNVPWSHHWYNVKSIVSWMDACLIVFIEGLSSWKATSVDWGSSDLFIGKGGFKHWQSFTAFNVLFLQRWPLESYFLPQNALWGF